MSIERAIANTQMGGLAASPHHYLDLCRVCGAYRPQRAGKINSKILTSKSRSTFAAWVVKDPQGITKFRADDGRVLEIPPEPKDPRIPSP